MNAWTSAIPYFPAHELACHGTGVIRLDMRFAAALPELRRAWGKPLHPSSVCRTPEHNDKIGGHPRSMHLTENPARGTDGTAAADISWRLWSEYDQLEFARLAWRQGWAVGLHRGFCHVDLRHVVGLAPVVYTYSSWTGFGKEQVRS